MTTDTRAHPRRAVVVYGAPPGVGGLGVQSANAIAGLASGDARVDAIGPAGHEPPQPLGIRWHASQVADTARLQRWTPYRWYTGALQYRRDRRLGREAARQVARLQPTLCYAFTQVALETLRWARANRIPSILESPNGHIRAFQAVYRDETACWCPGQVFRGHPTDAMVRRVEEEYELADRIRVSSAWARESLAAGGVRREKIEVLQQPVDLERYVPSPRPPRLAGPLSVCVVGSLDLRKGFVYLLRALRARPDLDVHAHFVGATGDRCSRLLFARERQALAVTDGPGDPREVLKGSDVMVLPTLEDGSPFAVAEAMACGVPPITTTATGAAEWIEPGVTGWIVPARDVPALAAALENAIERRSQLHSMGAAARRAVEQRANPRCHRDLFAWAFNR